MKASFTLLGWEIPSQNVTMRRHWRINHQERIKLERWIRQVVGRSIPRADGPRGLHIHSVRKQRIADDANLRGGAKGLVDACAAAGLIVDDKDTLAKITYSQATRAQAKMQQVATIITVEIP